MAQIGPFPLWLNAVSRRPRTHYKTHPRSAGLSEGGSEGRHLSYRSRNVGKRFYFICWCCFLSSNGMVEYEGPLRVRGALCILTILTFPTEIFSSSGLEIYLLLFNVSSGTASSGAPSLPFQIHSMRHATSLLYISREGLNLVRPTGGLEHVLSALPGYVGIMDIVFRS